MDMRAITTLVLFVVLAGYAQGQSYRSLVDDGNDAYTEKKYDAAEKQYKESIREKPERLEGHFNLGNAEYRKSDIQAALDAYKNAATKAKSKEEVAQTLYNVGNSYLKAAEAAGSQPQQAVQGGGDLQKQGYQQAIEAYKHSLKLNPKDSDARYNLVYAMKKLEELQNQQNKQNQDKKQDKKDDKKEDQNQKNKDQKQDDQKKDKQDKDQQQQQNQKDQQQKEQAKQNQEQQSQPKEQKMSKEQAEQILKALERDEKALQKKVRAQKGSRVKVEKDW